MAFLITDSTMNIGSVITFLCLFVYAGAQVTGTDPPVGSCLCMNAGGVNVRDSGMCIICVEEYKYISLE